MDATAPLWESLLARLDPADREALRRQGFVSAERRRTGAVTYKLRWRRDGRQRVRYLSSDPAAAAGVAAALAAVQAPGRAVRRLAGLAAEARALLAAMKRALAPELEARGYRYHGYTVRRTRATPGPARPDRPI